MTDRNRKKRFEVVFTEAGFAVSCKIIRDNETGALYLFHESGYAGGLTPLIGEDGLPAFEKWGVEAEASPHRTPAVTRDGKPVAEKKGFEPLANDLKAELNRRRRDRR
ncbi:MAG: DUF6440 family protein [Oscillospiraceae bacterium]|nr:DUF6440 family protein [Oscillospiraceae bacterium]